MDERQAESRESWGWKEEVMAFKDFEEKMAGLLRERFGETAQISVQDILKITGSQGEASG